MVSLTDLSNLLEIEHINYFYLFVFCFVSVYFLIIPLLYFYIYKFKKNHLVGFKIQKNEPTNGSLLWNITWSTTTIIIWTFSAYLLFTLTNKGYTEIYFNFNQYGVLYFIFTIILFTILWDTYYYWIHKFMHSSDVVYTYAHSVHHKTINPTPFSIFAFSPIEASLLGFYFVIVCFIIPIHIFAVMAVFLINVFANIIGHLGYEFSTPSMNKVLDKFFINSIHHNMHHKYAHMNYGIYFPFWDKAMGTFHPRYKEERESFYKNKNAN